MKKLLLLGGMRYLLPVIKAARELGCHIITCDNVPDNIAHRYSDEYHNVSIVEKDKVLRLAEELHIDGVMSFACDPGVVTAAYVAEKLGLPTCGPYESVCVLQNKGKFRKFLAENGFNVPAAKCYRNAESAVKDADMFNWPVIVKPTDSAGSKGVVKVTEPAMLRESIDHALSYSIGKEFIIEDFIENSTFSSDCENFSVNGRVSFVSFSNQHFDENAANPYTPAAYSWPSKMSSEHQTELSSELQRLITLLNMKTSIYNVEARVGTDGKAYLMEVSPRGGGNRLAECMQYITGAELVKNSVRAALGMPTDFSGMQAGDGYYCEAILHADKEGVFDGLWISDEIKSCVVEEDLWIMRGERVSGFSAANQAIGTLILRFKTMEIQEKFMSDIKTYVKVTVC